MGNDENKFIGLMASKFITSRDYNLLSGTESLSVRWTAFIARRLNRDITVKFSTFGKIRLIDASLGKNNGE